MDKKQTTEPAYLNLFKIKLNLKTTNTLLAGDERAKFLSFKKQLEETFPVQLTDFKYGENSIVMDFNENIVDGKLLIFPLLLELEKYEQYSNLLHLELMQHDRLGNIVMIIKFTDLKLEYFSKPEFCYENDGIFKLKTVFSYNKLEYIF